MTLQIVITKFLLKIQKRKVYKVLSIISTNMEEEKTRTISFQVPMSKFIEMRRKKVSRMHPDGSEWSWLDCLEYGLDR